MAFQSSGLRELNSSPTAENKLLFTALATCGEARHLHKALPLLLNLRDMETLAGARENRHTNPVEAGFPAELVGPRRCEVIVGPEGLVKCCDEVEQSLPATLVAQGVLPILAALPQPQQDKRKFEVISR